MLDRCSNYGRRCVRDCAKAARLRLATHGSQLLPLPGGVPEPEGQHPRRGREGRAGSPPPLPPGAAAAGGASLLLLG